jgi:hypothetical protein
LPPCRPSSRPRAALYIIPAPGASIPGRHAIVSERCYSRDGQFVVRRGGVLVPASSVHPMPDAILMMSGSVHVGFNFVYPTLAEFALVNSCDPSAKPLGIEALKRPSAGPLALG